MSNESKMTAGTKEQNITEDEAALYDRQIRLWGLDAQRRFVWYNSLKDFPRRLMYSHNINKVLWLIIILCSSPFLFLLCLPILFLLLLFLSNWFWESGCKRIKNNQNGFERGGVNALKTSKQKQKSTVSTFSPVGSRSSNGMRMCVCVCVWTAYRQCPLLAPSVRGLQMVCVRVDGMNLKYALRWHFHISLPSVLCQCYTQAHAHTHPQTIWG